MTPKVTGEGPADVKKKSIAIFGYKHWLLSIEMKTKVVQHVPRIIFADFQTFLSCHIATWHIIYDQRIDRKLYLAEKSLGHAEQLLFSCLCSKVAVYSRKLQCFFFDLILLLTLTLSHSHPLSLSLFLTLTLFQSLIQSLLTCWTSFVFMSRLKSRCL